MLTGSGVAADSDLVARPLAPRSGPRGSTLFTRLNPEATGLLAPNRYHDPRMWWELHQEFKFGAIGSGVAIGDYDQDGRPDILVVSKVEGPRLFRNAGNWRFEDVTRAAGLEPSTGWFAQGLAWVKRTVGSSDEASPADGPWHQGVTWVDVNNDGALDAYVCRFGAPNLLYINQGNGTFREEAAARGLAVVDASSMAAFADYDRDGWVDVYVQTNLLDVVKSPTGQRDYLFRNRGDGTFVDVSQEAGLTGLQQGHSATWWDYDHDGWPDLYIANDFAPADLLYRNQRDGTFRNVIDAAVPQMPHSAMGADLGDVNNDGLVDLFVADMAATNHVKDQRGMARIRALLTESSHPPGSAAQFMRNALYLATGTPHLLEAGTLAGLAATDWTWSVRFEDLDNDGWLDLHVTNGMVRELHNADLVQRASATDNVSEGVRLLKSSAPLAEPNLAFRNRGDLQFENVSAAWGLDQRGVSFGAAFGDLDGDGDLDVVFTNYEQPATLLRNDSATGGRLIVALRGTKSNRLGLGATVRIETSRGTQVRTLVLARGYLSSSEPVLHFGLGDAPQVDRLTVHWPSGRVQSWSHLAVNQHLTLTEDASLPAADAELLPPVEPLFADVSAASGLNLLVEQEAAEGTLPQPLLPRGFNRRGPALAAGDLDGDGRDDLVIGGSTRTPARILRPEPGDGTSPRYQVRPLAVAAKAVNDGPVLQLEFNGDGHPDLLVTRGGANLPADAAEHQPALWLGDGRGGFTPAPEDALPRRPMSAGAAVAADFDRDGKLDVFLGARLRPGEYPTAPASALLFHRDGKWQDVTDALAPDLRHVGLVTSALASDVDGDGWVDLLVALEWGPVAFWRNEEGRGFRDRSAEAGFSAAGSGWWSSLAGADFNGDGRLDYIAGNAGLNTPYRASPQSPAVLYSLAPTPGRPAVLLEGYYEGERLYPRRNRNQLAAHLPGLARRFPRNDLFARATLPEIVGEDALAQASRWTATELRSGVFLSQVDGPRRFVPLPNLAQLAPVEGLAIADVDADGFLDLLFVQSSYAPDASNGRFSGGLGGWLRGDGRGGFQAVPPRESGFIVPGDAEALVLLDVNADGRPDAVVSRQGEPLLAYVNRHDKGRPLAVRLEGLPGNPTAVGARVTLQRASGAVATAEVHAGSGYASQSAPALFFGSGEDAPVRIVVRWPDGATSEHDPASPVLTLRHPQFRSSR